MSAAREATLSEGPKAGVAARFAEVDTATLHLAKLAPEAER